MSEKSPQNSINSERSALGCAMFDVAGADTVLSLLKRHHFHLPEHQELYDAIEDQRKRNVRPDMVTTAVSLSKTTGMSELEAGVFLLEILETVPHSENAPHYCAIVADKYRSREGISVLRDSLAKFESPGSDTIELLSDAADAINNAIADGISDAPQTAAEAMVDALTTEEVAKIPIGFTDLDSRSGGVAPKTMTVVGARPGIGKTSLVIEILRRLTMLGVPALLFSVEMSRRSIVMRLGSMQLGLPFNVIRDGRLGDENRQSLEAMQRADWMSRFHIDEESRTVDEMAAIVRQYVRRFGVKVVAIDYLQLVPPTNARQPREQQVSEISRRLKQMAKSANVALIVLAQLNRDIERRDQKKPKVSDLRESGSIEQDADQVWLLWRPNKDTDANDDHAELIVAKNRNGETGSVMLAWHGPTMTYDDMPDLAFMSAADSFAETPL